MSNLLIPIDKQKSSEIGESEKNSKLAKPQFKGSQKLSKSISGQVKAVR